MKKFVSMLLALVMVFALCACGSKTEDGDKAESIKVGFICLHDENSTYDKNFIDAAKAACKNAGLSEDQYIIKTNIPEGQECYNAAAWPRSRCRRARASSPCASTLPCSSTAATSPSAP